jgi:hypothetical protein
MNVDQLNGIRVLIDRLGLPPRLKELVKRMEEKDGALELVAETPGGKEVREVLHMVDGPNLMTAIVATLLNHVEVPEEELAAHEAEQDTRTPYERWQQAVAAYPDPIVLLLVNGNYLTFDAQAERLAADIDEHNTIVDGRTCIALSENTQSRWAVAIADKELDVILVTELEDGGYTVDEIADVVLPIDEFEPPKIDA